MSDTATLTPETGTLSQFSQAPLLFPELTAKDRCDSCSGAAVAQVKIGSGDSNLLFCGHHWRKQRAGIEARGYLYATTLDEVDSEPFTWASHDKPWPNQFRDAGSATA